MPDDFDKAWDASSGTPTATSADPFDTAWSESTSFKPEDASPEQIRERIFGPQRTDTPAVAEATRLYESVPVTKEDYTPVLEALGRRAPLGADVSPEEAAKGWRNMAASRPDVIQQFGPEGEVTGGAEFQREVSDWMTAKDLGLLTQGGLSRAKQYVEHHPRLPSAQEIEAKRYEDAPAWLKALGHALNAAESGVEGATAGLVNDQIQGFGDARERFRRAAATVDPNATVALETLGSTAGMVATFHALGRAMPGRNGQPSVVAPAAVYGTAQAASQGTGVKGAALNTANTLTFMAGAAGGSALLKALAPSIDSLSPAAQRFMGSVYAAGGGGIATLLPQASSRGIAFPTIEELTDPKTSDRAALQVAFNALTFGILHSALDRSVKRELLGKLGEAADRAVEDGFRGPAPSMEAAGRTKVEAVAKGLAKPEEVASPERIGPVAAGENPPPVTRPDGSIAAGYDPQALEKGLVEPGAVPAVEKAKAQGVETVSSGVTPEGAGFAIGRAHTGEVVRVEAPPAEGERGTAYIPELSKEAKGKLTTIRGAIAQEMYPRTGEVSRTAQDEFAAAETAHEYAKQHSKMDTLAILSNLPPEARSKYLPAVVQAELDGTRAKFQKDALMFRLEAQAETDPQRKADLLADAEKATTAAANVRDTFGQKGAFPDRASYEAFASYLEKTGNGIGVHKKIADTRYTPDYVEAAFHDETTPEPENVSRFKFHTQLLPKSEGERPKGIGGPKPQNIITYRTRAAIMRTGAGEYELSDLQKVLRNQIEANRTTASRVRGFKELQAAGYGFYGKAEDVPATLGDGEPVERLPIQGRGGKNFYVAKSLAGESHAAFNTNEKPMGGLAHLVTGAQLLINPSEWVGHIKRIGGSVLGRPSSLSNKEIAGALLGGIDMIPKAFKMIASMAKPDETALSKVVDVSAMRPSRDFDPKNPMTYSGAGLHRADSGLRAYASSSFDAIVKATSGSKHPVLDTPSNRRDFINGMAGNYSTRSWPILLRFAKQSGFAPYLVPKLLMIGNLGKTATLSAGLQGARARQAAFVLARVAGLFASTYAINRITTGKGDPGKDVNPGEIVLGTDNGDYVTYDLADVIGLRRQGKWAGLDAVAHAIRNGKSADEALGVGFQQIAHEALKFVVGPATGTIYTAATGREAITQRQIGHVLPPGQQDTLSQIVENLKAAGASLNPLGEAALAYAAGWAPAQENKYGMKQTLGFGTAKSDKAVAASDKARLGAEFNDYVESLKREFRSMAPELRTREWITKRVAEIKDPVMRARAKEKLVMYQVFLRIDHR